MVGEGPEPSSAQAPNMANESMENIFEQNLRQLSTVEVEMEERKEASGKHKIDLLDNMDEDDQEEPQDLDEDEKIIKQNIKKNRFESIFGIEGEESAVSAGLRKSRDNFSKKSSARLRSSIAGKFLIKRETESEFSTKLSEMPKTP